MTKMTAGTRVLARWMAYIVTGAMATRLWAELCFMVTHLESLRGNHKCEGTWGGEMAGDHTAMILALSGLGFMFGMILAMVIPALWRFFLEKVAQEQKH